jgi:hypothetical protein
MQPGDLLRAGRKTRAPYGGDRTQRAVRPGVHTGSLAPTVTPARRANVSGSRPGWSMFTAHPWSLINDHRAAPGRFGDSFPRRLNGPRAARWSWAARHRACDVLRMDERNVRGQQQDGGPACKPEASHSSASRREGGSSFGSQRRRRGTPDGWPPLLTAGEVAVVQRTSRKAVFVASEARLAGRPSAGPS